MNSQMVSCFGDSEMRTNLCWNSWSNEKQLIPFKILLCSRAFFWTLAEIFRIKETLYFLKKRFLFKILKIFEIDEKVTYSLLMLKSHTGYVLTQHSSPNPFWMICDL